MCFKTRRLVSLHLSVEVSPTANLSSAGLEYTVIFILSNSNSSVYVLAHSALLKSFKNFQNALSSTPLSNFCDEFCHFEHNCQDVKLRILQRKHEIFGFLLEEDTVV